jgi:hypothetical protein
VLDMTLEKAVIRQTIRRPLIHRGSVDAAWALNEALLKSAREHRDVDMVERTARFSERLRSLSFVIGTSGQT